MDRIPEPEYMDDAAEAEAYARADFSQVNQECADRVLTLAGRAETLRLLDLGTGPGDIPIRIAKVRPGWRITGVDASDAMLRFARAAAAAAGCADRLEWVQTDAKALPFPEAAFDVVFSNSIVHHINDTGRFWAEVKRVARPGALLVIRDLARPASAEEAWRIVEKYSGNEAQLLKDEFHRSLLAAYTPDEVRAQLWQANINTLWVGLCSDRHWLVDGWLQLRPMAKCVKRIKGERP